jgi:hypothetical protein
VKTLKRNEKKMYGFRKVNPRMQKARAEQREELCAKQDIQRKMLTLKSKMEKFEQHQEESPSARRKQVKIVAQLDHFFKLISPGARREIFRGENNEAIWEEPNSTEEHRTRAIGWPDAWITDEIAKGFKGVAARFQLVEDEKGGGSRVMRRIGIS